MKNSEFKSPKFFTKESVYLVRPADNKKSTEKLKITGMNWSGETQQFLYELKGIDKKIPEKFLSF